MRFLAPYALLFVAVAFVQSKPINSRNGLDFAALISQFSDLNTVHALFPQYSDLVNRLVAAAYQVGSNIPDDQLYLLQQQAFGLGQAILDGQIDINTAADHMMVELKKHLSEHPSVIALLESLKGETLSIVNSLFSGIQSRSGKRTAGRIDLDFGSLISQFSNLNLVHLLFPQFSDLVNRLSAAAYEVGTAIPDSELFPFADQCMALGQAVFNGQININTAADQIMEQLRTLLKDHPSLVARLESLKGETLAVVTSLFSGLQSTSGKRTASRNGLDFATLINQFSDLNTIHAMFPEYSDLVNRLVAAAYQVGSNIHDDDLETLKNQAFGLGAALLNGETTVDSAVAEMMAQLRGYLSSHPSIVALLESLAQEFSVVVNSFLA